MIQPERMAHLQTQIERGRQAQELLTHPILMEAEKNASTAIYQNWVDSKPNDTDLREKLWASFQGVGELTAQLRTIATAGVVAQAEIDEDKLNV